MRSIGELEACAGHHLDRYTDPARGFAFATYDHWWNGDPGLLTPLDCFAANLLNLNLDSDQVIPLFQPGAGRPQALREAMQRVLGETDPDTASFLDLDSIDDEPFTLVRRANTATGTSSNRSVTNWTPVTVSKVLHRLRPNLVPIIDSKVRAFYDTAESDPPTFFRRLHADLTRHREMLDELAEGRATPDGRPLSQLRVADIVIWHHVKIGGCPTT